MLILAGADGGKLDAFGCNVLMLYLLVAEEPCFETLKFLVGAGSSVKHVNKLNWTTLHFAAANPNCSIELMQWLVRNGADDFNRVTELKENVISLYVERSNTFDPDLVRFLVREGFDCALLAQDLQETVKALLA